MGIDAKIAGMWHAGSYDPQDFLGRLIKDKSWSYNFERSLYHAIDYNFFATQFHIDLFWKTIIPIQGNWSQTMLDHEIVRNKIVRTGLPLTFLPDVLEPYKHIEKEDIILFPHRLAPEKQPEIFRDLAVRMPQYKFIVAQDSQLSKDEYHKLIAKSKIVFSANLQETLGISPYEGTLLGALPLLPNRLSYCEQYPLEFLYDSALTTDFDTYLDNQQKLMDIINHMMENYDKFKTSLPVLNEKLTNEYFSADIIIQLFNNINK